MSDDLEQRYDAVPYRGGAFARTHPDRMGALGVLCGLDPAPIEGARVLEIGCGDGGNLIPLAFAMPKARLLGFDLSGEAVARGRRVIEGAGLGNVELRQQDIMAFDAAEGPFDYVIAHGVYSWVPDAVRLRLLDLIRAALAPHGLAFVSYAANPGGYVDEMMRQILLHHVRDIADPAAQIQAARAFVETLAQVAHADSEEGAVYAAALTRLRSKRDTVLLHDDLSPVVHREWRRTFSDAVARHGLRAVVESGWSTLNDHALTPQTRDWLAAAAPDPETQAEYRDLALLRRFREDLLCRADAPATHGPAIANVARLRFRAAVRSAGPLDLAAASPVEFRSDGGTAVTIEDPIAKAAMAELGRVYPGSLDFRALYQQAQAAARPDSPSPPERLAMTLWQMLDPRLVQITRFDPPFARAASERPIASPLARYQLRNDLLVTSLLHVTTDFSDAKMRAFFLMLDGTRDRATIARELPASPEQVEAELARLQRAGFLVA